MILAIKATLLRWHRSLASNFILNDINYIARLIRMYYTKTTAGATIATAIPKVVKAPIPIPSQVVSAAVASRDVANLHAKEGATPVAKKNAVAAKPEAQAPSKMRAQQAGKAVLKPSAKPILKATPNASGKQAVSQKAEISAQGEEAATGA
ncbi:MAG: hypothetical protein Q7U13_02925 [Rhodoferax sp.]|nr:hypothetical protein [Rhodoferax sp.]